jgi:hypothetical protein
MPSTAELYWANARECLRWAHESISEAEREKFLEMAKVWTQLAIHRGQQSKDQINLSSEEGPAPKRRA